jgi:hypothetical protein
MRCRMRLVGRSDKIDRSSDANFWRPSRRSTNERAFNKINLKLLPELCNMTSMLQPNYRALATDMSSRAPVSTPADRRGESAQRR